jgi:hypothetical protein
MGQREEANEAGRPAALAAAMQDPGREFRRPDDVVARTDWSIADRFAVLRQWKYDLGQLQVATEENMPPGGPGSPVTIADVHAAMEALGMPPGAEPAPTKGA